MNVVLEPNVAQDVHMACLVKERQQHPYSKRRQARCSREQHILTHVCTQCMQCCDSRELTVSFRLLVFLLSNAGRLQHSYSPAVKSVSTGCCNS